ncbi:cbb3-type cytochrome oxidase assembly protein CcoS [Colwelliaceae bacterium MEBiC 14330]
MSIIYVLIPIAALLTALGIYLFFWAVKTEQFDDLEKQGMSILFDEEDKNTCVDEQATTAKDASQQTSKK